MKKNRIVTNSLRTIKRSFSRFLPLFTISMLGVFVFAGLQSVKPDMLKTLDQFLDEHQFYDLKIVSTKGLTEDDIQALKNIENVKQVEGSYSVDTLIQEEDYEFVINISSLPQKINTVTLQEGRLPTSNQEIVVEENFLKKTSYKIGDIIKIDEENLKEKEFTIVGTITSALYFNNDTINQNRGTTTIGMGTINYYTYVLESAFKNAYMNAIFVKANNTEEYLTSEKNYLQEVDSLIQKIEAKKPEREQARYDFLYQEIQKEIEVKETDGQKEFASIEKKLNQAKQTLNTNKKTLTDSKKKIAEFSKNLETMKTELETEEKKFQEVLTNMSINDLEIESLLQKTNENITLLNQQLVTLKENSLEYQNTLKQLKTLEEQQKNLLSLQNAKIKIKEGKKEIEANQKKLEDFTNQYQIGQKNYQKGLTEYQNSMQAYQKSKKEFEEKINEAKKELETLEKPVWYIYDRSDLTTYQDYIDDITSINNLSQIIPVVFFAVAILVSLISMNRMVEEERIEIGTLKSLGFTSFSILHKYLLFSSIATILGGIIGGILGIIILPTMIFNIYSMLFHVPNFKIGLNLGIIFFSLILSFFCIGGTTIFTVEKVLKEKPSELMRPKAPKKGKRIFLENCKWFWKRLSFSNKVTFRNLFRYKKRGIATIIGITGCSAIMLCGFGIRDAIIDIANLQFKETFHYDGMVYLNSEKPIDSKLFENPKIKKVVKAVNQNVKVDNIDAILFAAKSDEIDEIVNLQNKENRKITLQKESVIITDKLADLKKLNVGDTITWMDENNNSYEYQISGITKNYLNHYIYIDEDSMKTKSNTNSAYLKLNDMTKEEKDAFASELLNHEEVLNISYTEDMLLKVKDMLTSLNKVVIIILVLSAILSFVVLYNLSNININERKREISTLKVLGFYDKEVDHYITKENIIFTLFGILLGCIAGYFLTNYVITTVEIEKARFIHHISIYSYLYTALITITFTFIVNFVIHFHLKKIDMIASLKSVD